MVRLSTARTTCEGEGRGWEVREGWGEPRGCGLMGRGGLLVVKRVPEGSSRRQGGGVMPCRMVGVEAGVKNSLVLMSGEPAGRGEREGWGERGRGGREEGKVRSIYM